MATEDRGQSNSAVSESPTLETGRLTGIAQKGSQGRQGEKMTEEEG